MKNLSELEDDVKIINEHLNVYEAGEVKCDIKHYIGGRWYIAREYHASIDARSMLETAIEHEYDNMYEDWDERIWNDITEEDINKFQQLLDGIFLRDIDGNTAYFEDEQIDLSK